MPYFDEARKEFKAEDMSVELDYLKKALDIERNAIQFFEKAISEAESPEAAPAQAEPAAEARPEPEQEKGGKSRKGGRDQQRGGVVGMGDHTPAFLLRPVRRSKADEQAADDETVSETENEAA